MFVGCRGLLAGPEVEGFEKEQLGYASEFHYYCIWVISVPCQTFYEANAISSIA
jgi:hypothetical protein